jgi:hypothetical protein
LRRSQQLYQQMRYPPRSRNLSRLKVAHASAAVTPLPVAESSGTGSGR